MTITTALAGQCVHCGGDIVPAGADDWKHVGSTLCTDLATPVLCRYDCAMPALTGSLVCEDH